jgi:hypothetical protein
MLVVYLLAGAVAVAAMVAARGTRPPAPPGLRLTSIAGARR